MKHTLKGSKIEPANKSGPKPGLKIIPLLQLPRQEGALLVIVPVLLLKKKSCLLTLYTTNPHKAGD